MSRVAVIGGGAAGMMAAIAAAEHGHQVQLFEKNEKLGKKYILRERAGAMSPMPAIQRNCLQRLYTTPSFFTAAFTALQTEISWNW